MIGQCVGEPSDPQGVAVQAEVVERHCLGEKRVEPETIEDRASLPAMALDGKLGCSAETQCGIMTIVYGRGVVQEHRNRTYWVMCALGSTCGTAAVAVSEGCLEARATGCSPRHSGLSTLAFSNFAGLPRPTW